MTHPLPAVQRPYPPLSVHPPCLCLAVHQGDCQEEIRGTGVRVKVRRDDQGGLGLKLVTRVRVRVLGLKLVTKACCR